MNAIFYVLRTGCQWNALPRCLGASSTVHGKLQLWVKQRVFERIWELGLEQYAEEVGINWGWMAMDGAMVKAPLEVREILKAWGSVGHIPPRDERERVIHDIPNYGARRWVMERTHSWMNRFRRLLIR